MANPAYDAVSHPSEGTGDLSWTHTPAGTPRAALVFVSADYTVAGTVVDGVNTITYGGAAMTEVALSPSLLDSGEDSVVCAFFLDNVAAGAQTVAVDTTSTDGVRAALCYTVTASGVVSVEDTAVNASATIGTTPSVTLTTGVGVETFCASAFWSGRGTIGNITPDASLTADYSFDYGAAVVHFNHLTTNDAGSNATMAWTTTGDDEGNILGVALKATAAPETVNVGLVTVTVSAFPVTVSIASTWAANGTLSDPVDRTSYTLTLSRAILPNELALLAVENSATSSPPLPDTVTGGGVTWVQVGTRAVSNYRTTLYRAMGSSPSGTSVVAAFPSGQIGCAMACAVLQGAVTTGTSGADALVQSAINGASSGDLAGTVTLSAFANAANNTFGVFGHNANEALVPGTGFTQLANFGHGQPGRALLTMYQAANDTTVDASWPSTGSWNGIAAEIGMQTLTQTVTVGLVTITVSAPAVTPTGGAATVTVGLATVTVSALPAVPSGVYTARKAAGGLILLFGDQSAEIVTVGLATVTVTALPVTASGGAFSVNVGLATITVEALPVRPRTVTAFMENTGGLDAATLVPILASL